MTISKNLSLQWKSLNQKIKQEPIGLDEIAKERRRVSDLLMSHDKTRIIKDIIELKQKEWRWIAKLQRQLNCKTVENKLYRQKTVEQNFLKKISKEQSGTRDVWTMMLLETQMETRDLMQIK